MSRRSSIEVTEAKEANFASVTSIDDLRDMQESGEYQFVDDFFTDYEAVLT
jgi:hypothetical protein